MNNQQETKFYTKIKVRSSETKRDTLFYRDNIVRSIMKIIAVKFTG